MLTMNIIVFRNKHECVKVDFKVRHYRDRAFSTSTYNERYLSRTERQKDRRHETVRPGAGSNLFRGISTSDETGVELF